MMPALPLHLSAIPGQLTTACITYATIMAIIAIFTAYLKRGADAD